MVDDYFVALALVDGGYVQDSRVALSLSRSLRRDLGPEGIGGSSRAFWKDLRATGRERFAAVAARLAPHLCDGPSPKPGIALVGSLTNSLLEPLAVDLGLDPSAVSLVLELVTEFGVTAICRDADAGSSAGPLVS